MKVKDLKAKYPGYLVVEQGYPDSIPYTELPRELDGLRGKQFDRVCDELDVFGYEVYSKPFTSVDITSALFGGKKRPNKEYKGHLYIYLKGDKKRR